MHVRRRLLASLVVLAACGSAPPTTSLAGTWVGNVLVSFGALGTYGSPFALQVTVSGSTATITGICGNGGASVGAGTVTAPISNLGTGTYAESSGGLTCPAQTFGRCSTVVVTYQYASLLAGTDTDFGVAGYTDVNSVSLSTSGYSSGCGLGDRIQTSFIGMPAPVQ